MPEGISENPPPKKPGIVNRVIRTVKESLPWDPIGKKKRLIKPIPEKDLTPFATATKPSAVKFLASDRTKQEEAPASLATNREWSTLPDVNTNIKASEKFIAFLRDPTFYKQDSDPRDMISSLGFRVEKPPETGWFYLNSLLTVARERYKLPMAVYVGPDHHARLLVKGWYDAPQGKKMLVYNPYKTGFEEVDVKFDANGHVIGVLKNNNGTPLQREEFNLMKILESPDFAKYKDLLTESKAFGFQKDARNCIPYCLFVGAMLNGLELGNTPFKTSGIKQFEQDFGVRIMTREDILPKPRVRLV